MSLLTLYLAASGTLRTVLVLIIIWLLLRMWNRSRMPAAGPGAGPQRRWQGPEPTRPPGEVRIEQVEQPRHQRPTTDAEDADFEEIK